MPCFCEKDKEINSRKTGRPTSRVPKNVAEWQKTIAKIYPNNNGSLYFQLLKRLDDFHYTIRNFRRRLVKSRMKEVRVKSVDYFVLLLRLINASDIDLTKIYSKLFNHGCYICHKNPCECYYFE